MRVVTSGFALCCGLLLAGCGDTVPNSNPDAKPANGGLFAGLLGGAQPSDKPDGRTRPQMPPPLAKARLAGGDVVVEGPDGYCIDPTTVQTRGARGFALIASCEILSGGKVGNWVEPVLITVTVGPSGATEDLPTPSALATALEAKLLGGETSADFVAANLDRGGDTLLPGGDRKHWRGAFVQNGRLVGLALYAPKGSALAAGHGGSLLSRVKTKIAALSTQDTATQTTAKKKSTGGLLDRLFNRKDLP